MPCPPKKPSYRKVSADNDLKPVKSIIADQKKMTYNLGGENLADFIQRKYQTPDAFRYHHNKIRINLDQILKKRQNDAVS